MMVELHLKKTAAGPRRLEIVRPACTMLSGLIGRISLIISGLGEHRFRAPAELLT